MIQENVNQRFLSLGVLLLLNCPSGLQFGIDNISWKIENKFKGIKMIPLGTHIIAYSLQSENHMFKMSRFLIFTSEQKILVFRWNETVCQFLEVKGQECQGYRSGVRHFHFDTHLGPYPQQNLSFWSQTTKYITRAVLDKLDPIDKLQQFQEEYSKKIHNIESDIGKLTIDEEEEEGQQMIDEEKEEEEEDEKIKQKQNPGKFKPLSDSIYYSQIPRTLTASPEKITEINLDKTPILKRVIQKQWKNKSQNLLGELQYSFVHFIIGQNEESLTQWKKIVDLFVNSQTAYFSVQSDKIYEALIMNFIPVFYDQLNQFPVDFFRDELSKSNFICKLLKRFKEYTKGQQYSAKIKKRIKKLLELIQNKFEYMIDSSEDEDELPMVVSEQQTYF